MILSIPESFTYFHVSCDNVTVTVVAVIYDIMLNTNSKFPIKKIKEKEIK